MARTVRDARLDTRAARLRLEPRHEPYWRTIERGAHLGYRKGERGGVWLARLYREEDGRYRKAKLGRADDVLDADGAQVLTFAQAQARAREWFKGQNQRALGQESDPALTVAAATASYLGWFTAHRKGLRTAQAAIRAHILPTLGEKLVSRLTTAELCRWHEGLAAKPPRVRTAPGSAPRHRKIDGSDPDTARKRQATANRVLTVLKAMLNQAWREGKVESNEAWQRVKPFHDVDAPVIRYLTEAECSRLVNACEPDFRQLVRAALLTGCRYGELAALRVADFNPDAGTLAVRTSKSGKSRHVVLADEGHVFFADATAGRASSDRIFLHTDGRAWGFSHQARPLAEACRNAKIEPAISFHILRHTHGALLAMRDVPMAVIAHQLGHASTRMTERHYAHLAPSYVADTIRASFPRLGILGPGNVLRVAPRNR